MEDLEIYDRIEKDKIALLSDMMITYTSKEYTFESILQILNANPIISNIKLAEDMEVEYQKFQGIVEINKKEYYVSSHSTKNQVCTHMHCVILVTKFIC